MMKKVKNTMLYKEEIVRKLIHMSSLWIPILYLHSTTAIMLKILLPLTIGALVIEFTRKYSPLVNGLINKLIGRIMRDSEKNSSSFAGATHLFIAATLAIAFFNKEIAIFALLILVISDTCAALIGYKLSWIKINDKSLTGALSFVISAYAIYYYLTSVYNFDLPFVQSMIAIISAAIFELFSKKLKIDDNFLIPFAICMIMVW